MEKQNPKQKQENIGIGEYIEGGYRELKN